MAQVKKIDSNVTGLRASEELSLGVVDPSAVWLEQAPNSYSDFGPQITTVARNPITDDRQMKKGVATDLDASGGWSSDLTQESLPVLGQGVFFADIRTKDELLIPDVDTTLDDFQPASGGAVYLEGDLLIASGFVSSSNNGVHEVDAGGGSASSIPVTTNLVTAAGQSGVIRRCGHRFTAADISVVVTGDFAHYLSAGGKDLTELGLIPGEFIWVGGDGASSGFTNVENNGFKRVRSVSATQIVVDKSDSPMLVEAAAGITLEIYIPSRMLKNESDPTLIKSRSYQLERTLGAPDDAFPSQIQSEYIVGAVVSQLQVNVATADKLTYDLSFMGIDAEQRSGAVGVKAGTRPSLAPSEAYNSSSDVSRINMSVVSENNEAPTPLFGFVQEMSFTIDNNLTVNKAIGVYGGFAVTAGTFGVSGTVTAYFDNVSAMLSLRQNASITIDSHFVKENAGISFDFPLVTIGDGRPNVDSDTAITLPISFDASTGAKVVSTMDHTLMMMIWDYLPTVAEA